MSAPQFTLKVPKDGPMGSKLFFNGQEVALVTFVEVENTVGVDDVVKSRLIIELAGQIISVENID